MPPTSYTGQANSSSFLGLQSYTEAQSDFFFGRDAETDTLTSLIQLNTLTIVFGKSGTGKTSLLNAGVFPKLRKNFCLPFRIRLEFNDNSPDLVTQVKKILKEEIDKYGFKVDAYPTSETLWEYFHKEPLWKTVTPILVFDQFEEIFTLAKSNPRFASTELPAFWEELSNLIENTIPEKLKTKFLEQKEKIEYNYKKQKTKIVFSFREEYLPEFESIAAKIPSLKFSRFRLLPMNGHQAYEVLTKTWKDKINAGEAKHIVSYFTNEPGIEDPGLVTVEPSLLSQVCAYIDKERIESGSEKVSAELLNKYPKETILRSIYNEAVTAANNRLNVSSENAPGKNHIKEFLEEKLITSEGYRTKYNLGAKDEMLKPGIIVLTTKYFIREDDNTVELTHDVLAPIIKSDREKRRKEIAMTVVRKKARRRALILLLFAFLIAAASYYFITREARKDKARIEKTTAELTKKTIQLKADSLRLTRISDSLNRVYQRIELLIKNLQPSEKDSLKIDSLKNAAESLKDKYAELLVKYEKDVDSLSIRNPKHMRMPKPVFYVEEDPKYIELLSKYESEKKKYDSLLALYNKLDKLFNDYTNRFPDPIPIISDSKKGFDTTNSLRIKLFYSKKYNEQINPPENLRLYLIPYTYNNSKVIKNAKVYEINCNESDLQKAENRKTAIFWNGYYYFPDVDAGKYLIKICTYYGGFYTYKKESSGMETLSWDASPPIR
jgi:hypothetical protein